MGANCDSKQMEGDLGNELCGTANLFRCSVQLARFTARVSVLPV